MSSRYTGRIIEHTWDCPYCGNKNRGRDRECKGCGRPRGTETKFNTNEHIAVLDGEEAKQYFTGPDWFCECCDSYNPDTATECKSCGAPRGASKDYFEKRSEQEAKEREIAVESKQSYAHLEEPKTMSEKIRVHASRHKKSINTIGMFACIIIPIIVLILGLIFFLKPTQMEGIVTELTWSSTVNLEEFTTLKDEGWNYPSDARILDKKYIYKETIQVIDHYDTEIQPVTKMRTVQNGYDTYYTYEDLGNGFSKEVEHQTPHYDVEIYTDYETVQVPVYRDEDVYDWWYTYEYDRWLTIDTRTNSGNKGEETEPVFEITDDLHRMSPYTKHYYMDVQTEEDITTIEINTAVYNIADVGSDIVYKINRIGMVTIIKIDDTSVEEGGIKSDS